eukprot:8655377-Lingulodinium_polyedra.AAC.1
MRWTFWAGVASWHKRAANSLSKVAWKGEALVAAFKKGCGWVEAASKALKSACNLATNWPHSLGSSLRSKATLPGYPW